MPNRIATIIVSTIALFHTNSILADESPEDGLKAIVELYKSRDWEGLAKHRIVSAGKNENEADLTERVSSLRSQFSDEELLEALVSSYEAALAEEPQVGPEGKVAIFSSKFGSVKLAKMESGVWGLRY